MSTRGFEFAYMLDGGNATPVIRDFILSAAAAHKVGDLVTIATDGDVVQITAGTAEVTGVMQEAVGTADVSAGTTLAKVAIITRNQVWRCSTDATAATGVPGYEKHQDLADCNTIDADGTISGSMIIIDKSLTDDDGNIVEYVVFGDTTFGNA